MPSSTNERNEIMTTNLAFAQTFNSFCGAGFSFDHTLQRADFSNKTDAVEFSECIADVSKIQYNPQLNHYSVKIDIN